MCERTYNKRNCDLGFGFLFNSVLEAKVTTVLPTLSSPSVATVRTSAQRRSLKRAVKEITDGARFCCSQHGPEFPKSNSSGEDLDRHNKKAESNEQGGEEVKQRPPEGPAGMGTGWRNVRYTPHFHFELNGWGVSPSGIQ